MKNQYRNSNGNKLGFALVSRLPEVIQGFLACALLFNLSPAARAQGMASQIPASEYDALLDIYNRTGGLYWFDSSGWGDPTATNWEGVTVLNGHVAYINLNDNQLIGTMPTMLNNLPYLIGLDLSQNQLVGPMPTNWDNLTNLQSLYLYQNNLSGRIPAGLAAVPLLYVDLSFNHLTGGILKNIGNWTQAQTINFDYNQLCGPIPCGVTNCTNLSYLQLAGNRLEGPLPWNIGNLPYLTTLDVGYNRFTGTIPMSIGLLGNLTYLGMAGNQFTGSIPDTLGNDLQLQIVYLNDNRFSGNLPNTLNNLPNLKLILLDNNHFTGVVPDFTQWFGVQAGLTENFFDFWAGSPSQVNVNAMVAAGNTINYLPQNPAPLLGTPSFLAGSLQLPVIGLAATYTVDKSSDLKNWSYLGYVTVTNGSGVYVDTTANQIGPRFYRVWKDFIP